MTMKHGMFLFFLLTGFTPTIAQQLPLFSQYYFNDYIVNPSFTGRNNASVIQASTRQQWVGFGGAPSTYLMGYNGTIEGENIGIGMVLFKDDTGGAISQTGALLNYRYKVKLNQSSRLSLGLGVLINQYAYDAGKVELVSFDDELSVSSTQIVPDVNFGASYTFNTDFIIGVSINQVLESKLSNMNQFTSGEEQVNHLKRHFNASISNIYLLTDNIDFEPYIVARGIKSGPVQCDIGGRFLNQKKSFIGVNYRYKDALVFMLGYVYKKMTFGYSYDCTISKLRKYNSGSHEIVLRYTL
jgi:type IX secretion system PorP/SprF family membrane protein